jgi:hypothetical protein
VVWGEQWQPRVREAAESAQPVVSEEPAGAFSAAREVAHKVLNDREPGATDTRLALRDSEARAGKHGDSYEGYLLDVSLAADSELSGALDVLPANGEEGATATSLLPSAEHAYGHAMASLSIDRSGFRGDTCARS